MEEEKVIKLDSDGIEVSIGEPPEMTATWRSITWNPESSCDEKVFGKKEVICQIETFEPQDDDGHDKPAGIPLETRMNDDVLEQIRLMPDGSLEKRVNMPFKPDVLIINGVRSEWEGITMEYREKL